MDYNSHLPPKAAEQFGSGWETNSSCSMCKSIWALYASLPDSVLRVSFVWRCTPYIYADCLIPTEADTIMLHRGWISSQHVSCFADVHDTLSVPVGFNSGHACLKLIVTEEIWLHNRKHGPAYFLGIFSECNQNTSTAIKTEYDVKLWYYNSYNQFAKMVHVPREKECYCYKNIKQKHNNKWFLWLLSPGPVIWVIDIYKSKKCDLYNISAGPKIIAQLFQMSFSIQAFYLLELNPAQNCAYSNGRRVNRASSSEALMTAYLCLCSESEHRISLY